MPSQYPYMHTNIAEFTSTISPLVASTYLRIVLYQPSYSNRNVGASRTWVARVKRRRAFQDVLTPAAKPQATYLLHRRFCIVDWGSATWVFRDPNVFTRSPSWPWRQLTNLGANIAVKNQSDFEWMIAKDSRPSQGPASRSGIPEHFTTLNGLGSLFY